MTQRIEQTSVAPGYQQALRNAANVIQRSSEWLWPRLWFASLAATVLVLILRPLLFHIPLDHFYYLAQNFVHGDLSIDRLPGEFHDVVTWNGHIYLPLGPMPAIIMIPFLAPLSAGLDFGWISIFFSLFNGFLFWKALQQLGVSGERQNWAALMFFGGTTHLAVSFYPQSYYFGHVLTVTFILLSIVLTLDRRLPVLIGFLIGCAAATRITSIFAIVFPLWMFWRGEVSAPTAKAPNRLLQLASVLAGLAVPCLLLAFYNYARFGNLLDTGYSHAILGSGTLDEAMRTGFFSLAHIPKNLYEMLLQIPQPYPEGDSAVFQFPFVQPSQWGLSIFITTPALFYAFKFRSDKVRFKQAAWIAVVAIMLPIITYYGVGWIQFGFRYALDFMPFLALLAAIGLPDPLTPRARLLIFAGVFVNLWGCYWLLRWLPHDNSIY